MSTIIEVTRTVPITPARLYARWADCNTHPEWSTDLQWVRLDEPLAVGARGRLRPKGGPPLKFRVSELTTDQTFADTTLLPGARLTFRHHAEPSGTTAAEVTVTVTLTGPLAPIWRRLLGLQDAAAGVNDDLDRLVALLQSAVPAGN